MHGTVLHTIIGEASEVCVDEILKSHRVIKSFVPKLASSKPDTKGDRAFAEEQHPSKVI